MRGFYNIADNGSADLRSPEKEVCFRSWDLANSQMCEVRVATSNICGCNPPNRCGKRSGADFATTFWGFAKKGELKVQMFNKPQMLIEVQMFNLPLQPLFRKTPVTCWRFCSVYSVDLKVTKLFLILCIFQMHFLSILLVLQKVCHLCL